MNAKPTPFPELTVVKKVKRIIVNIAWETMLVAGITLMALVVLVLLVFPGGVEVLAIEWERAKRWIRRARAILPGKTTLFHAIGSTPSLAIRRDRRKLWGGASFT